MSTPLTIDEHTQRRERSATMLDFRPWPGLHNPHAQTIFGTVARPGEPPSEQTAITLADGDVLTAHISEPLRNVTAEHSVLMLHGLGGSHRSPYLTRLTRAVTGAGLRAVRINMRGCGSGAGLARKPYCGAASHDVREAFSQLIRRFPHSRWTLVGYSLTGNLVCKLAAEYAADAPSNLQQVIAVSPALDLGAAATRLAHPSNAFYENYFLRELVRYMRALPGATQHPGYGALARMRSIREYDEHITAPSWGYASAADYYARGSALPRLSEARVPIRVLYAQDDPVIDLAHLADVAEPSRVQVFVTNRGGHVGFLGRGHRARPTPPKMRWLEATLLDWIENPPHTVPPKC